jgi:hypothetical protein
MPEAGALRHHQDPGVARRFLLSFILGLLGSGGIRGCGQ